MPIVIVGSKAVTERFRFKSCACAVFVQHDVSIEFVRFLRINDLESALRPESKAL